MDDLPSLLVYCNDGLGLLYELAVKLSECEMLIHFLSFKIHQLIFPEVVAEIAIYVLKVIFGPMARWLEESNME